MNRNSTSLIAVFAVATFCLLTLHGSNAHAAACIDGPTGGNISFDGNANFNAPFDNSVEELHVLVNAYAGPNYQNPATCAGRESPSSSTVTISLPSYMTYSRPDGNQPGLTGSGQSVTYTTDAQTGNSPVRSFYVTIPSIADLPEMPPLSAVTVSWEFRFPTTHTVTGSLSRPTALLYTKVGLSTPTVGPVGPNDEIEYRVSTNQYPHFTHVGSSFIASAPYGTTIVPGSLTGAEGGVVNQTATGISIDFGANPGARNLTYRVKLNSTLPPSLETISNYASYKFQISYNGQSFFNTSDSPRIGVPVKQALAMTWIAPQANIALNEEVALRARFTNVSPDVQLVDAKLNPASVVYAGEGLAELVGMPPAGIALGPGQSGELEYLFKATRAGKFTISAKGQARDASNQSYNSPIAISPELCAGCSPADLDIEVPDTLFKVGDQFLAVVKVTSHLQDQLTVTFADPLLQEQPPSGLATDVILTVNAGALPPPFQLTPTSPTQSFPVVVTIDKRGKTKLVSSLSYTGSAGSSGTLNVAKDVLISPLEVTLRAKPQIDGQPIVNMLLNEQGQVTDAKGNLISPKVEVTVTNTSDQSVIASLQGVDPRARDTSDVLGRIAVAGDFPILFGTLAPGQTVTREFDLQIHQNGRWEFVALVSGAAVGSSQGFDISAHGAPIAVGATYPVEIDLDYLPSSAITNQNNGAFFLQPGSVLGVFASVQNLTSNSTLKFYGMQAEKHLNAFGADLTSDAGRAVDPPFVHDHTLDANSTEILSGKILTDKEGAPSGTAKWGGLERAFLVDNATSEKTAVTADDILIKSTWGGWLGDEATIRVIQDFSRPPAPPPLTGYEKLEAFDVGALEGMGQWTYDAFDAIGGLGRLAGTISADPTLLADAMGKGSRAVWEAGEMAVTTWKKMSPGQRDEFILSLCDEVLRRNLLLFPDERECEDIAGAKTFVQQALYPFFQGFENAYASNNPAAITQEWGRVAGHVSLELITSTFPTPKFTKYTKAAEAALLADSEALGTALNVQEEFLRAVESGPVSEATTIKHWGVGGENLRNMQDVFRRFGVIGYLRERSPEAFELIDALREAVWKPEAMKPKGLTDLDLLILGDDIPAILGKSGNRLNPKGITPIFMPPPDEIIRARLASQGHQEEVIAAVLRRAKTRRAEFEEFVPHFEAWSRPVATGGGIPVAGNYLDNGVPNPIGIGPNRGFRFERFAEEGKPIFYLPKMQDADGAFRYIAGDIDWVHFSFLDGSPLDSETAFKLYDAMRRCCGLQHPETITWIRDGQTVFKAKINQIAGYLRGEKALLEVSGETTRAVRIDQNLSRLANEGRNSLIFFEAGLKARTRATLADVESAFAYFQAKFPDRRLLAPFLWGTKFNYSINNSSSAVLARQASSQPSNRPSSQSFSRSSAGNQSDDSSLDVIEIFNGSQWIATDITSLPSTVSLVPTSGLTVDVPAGARVVPVVDLPQLFANELAGHLESWFAPGQTIVIAPGEATQEVRRIIAGTSLTLDRPLDFSHATGTLVAVVPASLANIIGPPPAPLPVLETPRLLNLSNRARVLNGDNVMIGGLIIAGSEPKKVLMRAVGNSIQINGTPLAGRLADPTLALHDGTGAQIAFNDDWGQAPEAERAEIANSGLQPTDPHEPAIIRTLNPGAYTTIVRGQNESNGIAVVETYDLNPTANSRLANLSARAYVDNGDNLMIAGAIVAPPGAEVVVRGIGPSLNIDGAPVSGRLPDPILQLIDANGTTIAENDNWASDPAQAAAITAAQLAPSNPAEAAIRLSLPAGATTMLLRGVNGTTGIGLVEIYEIPPAP